MRLSGLKKRWRIRLSVALITAAYFVLIDEVIKEGYVFDPTDLLNARITHEKIFVVLMIIGLLLGLKKSYRRTT